jgi:uncharacterized DUF497 family protein
LRRENRCPIARILRDEISLLWNTKRRLEHGQELIRIISARQATRQERNAYTG